MGPPTHDRLAMISREWVGVSAATVIAEVVTEEAVVMGDVH